MDHLDRGLSTAATAAALGVRPRTVEEHIENAMAKPQVRSRIELSRCCVVDS